MKEEKQTQAIHVPEGQARSLPMDMMRDRILSAQKEAQGCVEKAVAGARAMVASGRPAFKETGAQAARLAELNQEEVEKAFRKAQEVVARTFEQFSNPVPPEDTGGEQQG